MTALRPADATDLPAILAVMTAAFPPDWGEAWNEAQCRSFLVLPGCIAFVAGPPEQVRGFALVRTVLDEAELMMIAVHPAAQGHGLARAMLAEVKKYCASQQVRILHLEVRESNVAAINLYESDQFIRSGFRSDYYRGPDGNKANSITFNCYLSQD